MLNTKMFEVRDSMTYIPVIATMLTGTTEWEKRTLKRQGFTENIPYLVVTRLDDPTRSALFPHSWMTKGARTLKETHSHIIRNWDTLDSGDVIDVQFLLGETSEPKRSEIYADDTQSS